MDCTIYAAKTKALISFAVTNKGADQLRGYREADLRLCLAYAKCCFSHDSAHLLFIYMHAKDF